MVCRNINLPGLQGIACSRGERHKRCSVCGKISNRLCDYPLTGMRKGATCDIPLCEQHAYPAGKHESGPYKGDSIDYCLVHHEMTAGQQKLAFDVEMPAKPWR